MSFGRHTRSNGLKEVLLRTVDPTRVICFEFITQTPETEIVSGFHGHQPIERGWERFFCMRFSHGIYTQEYKQTI